MNFRMIKDNLNKKLKFIELAIISREVFIRNMRNIFMLCLVVNVPLNIIDIIAMQRFKVTYMMTEEKVLDVKYFIVKVLLYLSGFISKIGIVLIVDMFIKNENTKIEWEELFSNSMRRFPKVILIIFMLVLSGLMTFCLIVPVILIGVYSVFMIQIVIIKSDIRIIQAFSYIFKLFKDDLFKAFVYIFSICIFTFVIEITCFCKTDGGLINVFTASMGNMVDFFRIIFITVFFLNKEAILKASEGTKL